MVIRREFKKPEVLDLFCHRLKYSNVSRLDNLFPRFNNRQYKRHMFWISVKKTIIWKNEKLEIEC
jgi:hypothetical protein